MASEQMKYAEVQAVAGGVTAVQGSPGSGTDAWDSMLSRNIELYNFGQDGISTCAVCGAADDDYTGNHLISQNQSGSLNAVIGKSAVTRISATNTLRMFRVNAY